MTTNQDLINQLAKMPFNANSIDLQEKVMPIFKEIDSYLDKGETFKTAQYNYLTNVQTMIEYYQYLFGSDGKINFDIYSSLEVPAYACVLKMMSPFNLVDGTGGGVWKEFRGQAINPACAMIIALIYWYEDKQ